MKSFPKASDGVWKPGLGRRERVGINPPFGDERAEGTVAVVVQEGILNSLYYSHWVVTKQVEIREIVPNHAGVRDSARL